jgi:hypothetical protein
MDDDLVTNPRETMADSILEYARDLYAYWDRRGIKDGKIHVTVTPRIPGAKDESVGRIYGIEVIVERRPKALTANVEVTKRDGGFNVQFGKSTVHVDGGPVAAWAENLFR